MSNINVLVVESLQLEGSWDRPKKLTVGHVKQGYGKTVGLAAGNLAGAYVGKHAGRMIGNEKDNDKPLDNTKASHRVRSSFRSLYQSSWFNPSCWTSRSCTCCKADGIW